MSVLVSELQTEDAPRIIINPGCHYLIDDAIFDQYDHSKKDFHLGSDMP